MPLRNTETAYGSLARTLHWITAILILWLLALGIFMHELPQSNDAEVAFKIQLFSLHKTGGIIAFCLALFRLYWALTNHKPNPLTTAPPLQHFVAETVHWMLYAGILITPLAGYLHHLSVAGSAPIYLPVPHSLPFIPQTHDLGELSKLLHFLSAAMMVVSIFLHIGGALFHTLILRDDTLARMLPFMRLRGTDIRPAVSETLPKLAAALIFGGVLIAAPLFLASNETPGNGTALLSEDGNWDVDYDDSTLAIGISQMGSPVKGQFEDWETVINFDANRLDQSSIKTVIELDSLEIGMATSQARDAEFLNTEAENLATWQSTSIAKIGNGQYRAEGKLSLRGIEVPVPLEFTLAMSEDTAIAEGTAVIDRLDFGIGAIGYTTEASLGFQVEINIKIVAERDD